MVYVIDQNGKPLMPTKKYRFVRHLLKKKLAKVKSKKPFTIQLLYETKGDTKPVILGIDPGRTNIGLCAVDETGKPMFAAECKTRNKEVPKLMAVRREFRQAHRKHRRREKRQRRAMACQTVVNGGIIERHLPSYGEDKSITCKVIRNKEARFSNRKRPEGWLTPTANQLLQTHINLVRKVMKFLPVSEVVIEMNKFAFMQLDDPSVSGKDFCNGPLKGFDGSVKAAVSAMQDGECLLCSKPIEQYHHVREQHKDGSEIIKNRVGLCCNCHTKVHRNQAMADLLAKKNRGLRKKYDALGVLNQIVQKLYDQLSGICKVSMTEGWDTEKFRNIYGIPKEHYMDAYAIACANIKNPDIRLPEICYRIKQFRRHDRQACSREMLDRKYLLNGKVVATNRHKAMTQKDDSLAEYRQAGGDTGCLQVKPHPKVMKDMDRLYPGCQVINGKRIQTVLKKASWYYWFDDGNRIPSKKMHVTLKNSGLVFVSNT